MFLQLNITSSFYLSKYYIQLIKSRFYSELFHILNNMILTKNLSYLLKIKFTEVYPMKVKEKKRATLFDAIIPIVCLMLFLGISIFKYDASPHIPLIGGTLVAGLVATFKLGYKWNELEESIFNSIKMAMQAILIIMIVGVIIGTWIISGIVPSMIYWGLEILSPKIFFICINELTH